MTEHECGGYGSIFIGSALTDEQIKAGFGALYGVEIARVMVDRSNNWVEQDFSNIAVVCTIFEHPGEFPTHVELTLLDTTFSFPKKLAAIAQLSSFVRAPCIVEDLVEPLNDYVWVLVQHGQPAKRVWLDPDIFNQEDYGLVIGGDVDGPPPLD